MNKDELNALYPDAVAYLLARNIEPSDAFYARLENLRQTAWTVSKLSTIEQIEAVKQSLVKSLAAGQSFETWRKNTTAEMLALPKHYQEVVFRNATLTSYNGAKWASFRDNTPRRPILRYSAINDSRTRPSHSALHGLMMPVNDPRWQTIAPANGHNCRCTLLSLSERQAKAFGYDGVPEKLPTYEDKHGVAHTCKPDKGWENSPENPHLLELLRQREEKAGLSKAVYNTPMNEINNSVYQVASKHFEDNYRRLEAEINKHSGMKTIELREKLAIGLLWEVAVLQKETQQLFGTTTNKVWLSDDTLIKQIKHRQGQPIDIDSYQIIDDIINNADDLVIENENNIVFFKKNNDWYKAVVKTTRDKNELYLLSFSRSNEKEVSKKTGKKKATR